MKGFERLRKTPSDQDNRQDHSAHDASPKPRIVDRVGQERKSRKKRKRIVVKLGSVEDPTKPPERSTAVPEITRESDNSAHDPDGQDSAKRRKVLTYKEKKELRRKQREDEEAFRLKLSGLNNSPVREPRVTEARPTETHPDEKDLTDSIVAKALDHNRQLHRADMASGDPVRQQQATQRAKMLTALVHVNNVRGERGDMAAAFASEIGNVGKDDQSGSAASAERVADFQAAHEFFSTVRNGNSVEAAMEGLFSPDTDSRTPPVRTARTHNTAAPSPVTERDDQPAAAAPNPQTSNVSTFHGSERSSVRTGTRTSPQPPGHRDGSATITLEQDPAAGDPKRSTGTVADEIAATLAVSTAARTDPPAGRPALTAQVPDAQHPPAGQPEEYTLENATVPESVEPRETHDVTGEVSNSKENLYQRQLDTIPVAKVYAGKGLGDKGQNTRTVNYGEYRELLKRRHEKESLAKQLRSNGDREAALRLELEALAEFENVVNRYNTIEKKRHMPAGLIDPLGQSLPMHTLIEIKRDTPEYFQDNFAGVEIIVGRGKEERVVSISEAVEALEYEGSGKAEKRDPRSKLVKDIFQMDEPLGPLKRKLREAFLKAVYIDDPDEDSTLSTRRRDFLEFAMANDVQIVMRYWTEGDEVRSQGCAVLCKKVLRSRGFDGEAAYRSGYNQQFIYKIGETAWCDGAAASNPDSAPNLSGNEGIWLYPEVDAFAYANIRGNTAVIEGLAPIDNTTIELTPHLGKRNPLRTTNFTPRREVT